MLYHGTAPNNWRQTAPARASLATAHGVCMVSTLCGARDGSSPSFPVARIIPPGSVILYPTCPRYLGTRVSRPKPFSEGSLQT